mmetsp:Transcript_119435/g.283527  ORF Transcript_119435/g.283527 Transcript_119435/m.283527 type:complete len:83 (-) Transcript_119435:76-324(-)
MGLLAWVTCGSLNDSDEHGPSPVQQAGAKTASPTEAKAKQSKAQRRVLSERRVSRKASREMSARDQAQNLVVMTGFPMPFLP